MKRVQEYTNDGGQAKHACFRVALLLVVILNVYTHGEFVLKSYDMNNSPSSPLRGDFVIGWYRYQPIYPKRYSKYNTMPVHISTQHSKHKEITAENNQSADIFIESTLKRPKMIADYQFAERLRQSQKNDSFPLVNDIIVMGNNKKWIFYVIMNNGNALPAYQKLRNMNVKLVCGNQTIRNSFKVGKEDNIRLLKFVVNDALLSNTVSLIDGATSWKYISLPFQVLPVQPRRKVAICAYISDYNTANEIKSFLAFYLIQKVDTIIFYCAVNFNFFYNLLKKEIENGYVILYSYPWPLTNAYGKIQRSIQISQMNSCYYRHRSFFEYIVMIDVDEYMFSELFPNSLYKGIEYSFRINPGKKDLAIKSHIYKGKGDREKCLGSGRLFDEYDIRMDNKESGRQKQVVQTSSEGWFSVHWCFYCRFSLNVPPNFLRIAHFKAECTYNQTTEVSNTLKQYSNRMKEILAIL